MPLAFQSISHQSIAFGFFNIETDMLLLENTFFFATDFCDVIVSMRDCRNDNFLQMMPGYMIERDKIGDLMGAIYDIRYSGFIGEVYRHFPFPLEPSQFKQNPAGVDTQHIITDLIQNYGKRTKLQFLTDYSYKSVKIGEYLFSQDIFLELLEYVYRGGYPRWKDDQPPDYVKTMKDFVKTSSYWLLSIS